MLLKAHHDDNDDDTEDDVICVDMENRKVVFRTSAYESKHCCHSFHWIKNNDRHLLSVQSTKNILKFFAVDSETKQFAEDEGMMVVLADSDEINYVEYGKDFGNVYFVKNQSVLVQKSMTGDRGVVMSLELEEKEP